MAPENAHDQMVATGVQLGIWLEQDARPAVRRWSRSRDYRVRFLAMIAQSQIEDAAAKGDYAKLAELRETWLEAESESRDG